MKNSLDNELKEEISVVDICKAPRGKHIIYRLNIIKGNEVWDIGRRYRVFLRLHENLIKKYSNVVMPYFPPKEFLILSKYGMQRRKSYENRQILLEDYIRRVKLHPQLKDDELISIFLDRSMRYLSEIPDLKGMGLKIIEDLWKKIFNLPQRPSELITDMENRLYNIINIQKQINISMFKANYHREMGIKKLSSLIKVFEECSDVYSSPKGILQKIIDGMKEGIKINTDFLKKDLRLYLQLKASYHHRKTLKIQHNYNISNLYKKDYKADKQSSELILKDNFNEKYQNIIIIEKIILISSIKKYIDEKQQKIYMNNIWIKNIGSTVEIGYPSHISIY